MQFLRAKIIEKHISLSNLISGPDKDVSISIEKMKDLVLNVKMFIKLQMIKILNKLEKGIRNWAYRSVISNQNIERGKLLLKNDLF